MNGGLGTSVVALTGTRLVAVLAQFGAGVLAARLLTPEPLGAGGVGLSVGWIVAIVANAGLNIAAVYFLGQRPERRREIVAALLPLTAGALAAAFLLSLVVAPVVGPLTLGRLPWGLFAAAAALATATVGYELAGAMLLGLGDRRSYVVGDLVRSIATLLAVGVLLVGPLRTAAGYVVASAAGVGIPALWLAVRVRRVSGVRRPRLDRTFTGEALRMGLAGQLSNVLSFVNLRLDSLLVPALVSVHAGGVYFVATRVAEVLAQVSNAAAAMLFPHVSRQADPHDTDATERVCRYTVLVTIVGAVVLAVLAGPLLGLVFGRDYLPGRWALVVLCAAMVPLALGRVLAADLKGRGRVGVVSVASGAGAALTLVADVVLLPVLGMVGAAWACVLAYSCTAVVLLIAYRRATAGDLRALVPMPRDVSALVRLGVAKVART